MIVIDLPADLHFEDDEGHNLARLSRAVDPGRVKVDAVLVAGSSEAWTWAHVLDVDGDWVTFRPLTTAQAAARGNLVQASA